ncbi:uncharacterized protein LOC132169060 [Corylus avellana]|uniref:uncharacterized protein LOC132169060 n=1 Tax=Corylus avellana TaxID=13451 RepID=UPI00286A67BF|nr:uncharacterized protein LOC132169060 [Corylus avellana]
MAGIEGEGERMIKNHELFHKAMRGDWDEVVKIYRSDKRAHKAKITKSGDTALHIAVSDDKEEIVEEVTAEIRANGEEGVEALKVKNEQGNTALHVAASMGSVGMCQCIAEVDKSLVGVRNEDGETPFFLAAVHGKKEAFLCLLRICGLGEGLLYSRRNDGETILHVAIAGDYFDLAFQIIHLFENLVDSVNQHGFTPLHLLAAKPSAFRSGSHFGRCQTIIYHCIFVDELKVEVSNCQPIVSRKNPNDRKDPCYPENYKTCANFFGLVGKAIPVALGLKGKKGAQNQTNADLERQKPRHSDHQPPKAETSTESTNNKNSGVFKDVTTIGENGAQTIPVERDEGAWRDHLFPPNYVTCFEFVKLACKALLVVLGQGSTKIRKIQDKKEKHTWSVQIMNELLQRVSSYEDHVNTGTTPAPEVTSPTEGETRPYTIAEGSVTNSPTFWKEQEPNTQKDKSKESEGEDKTGEGINKPPGGAKNETTILITAKSGVTKIAKSILEHFPVAIQDMNADKKSLTLLTVQKRQPHELLNGTGKNHEMKKRETPILIAAKNGITEIVEKILERFPVAIHDRNAEKKNIVLLAVENRQPHVYKLLLKRNILKDTVFRVVDNEGNSALHLAAKLGDYKPWLIPGAALQMQWEIKWYEV